MASPSPFFVAGTGRSGTSRIADIIREHPLIDPGGLRDLADALTDRYDPTVGEDAPQRLRPRPVACAYDEPAPPKASATPTAPEELRDIISAMGYQ